MKEDLDIEFIKKHNAFISKKEVYQRLNESDETTDEVKFKEAILNHKEDLQRIKDLSSKIQYLIDSSCDTALIKVEKKYPKKIQKNVRKYEKLHKKNEEYPVNAKYLFRGIAAGIGTVFVVGGSMLISSLYFGFTPGSWPLALSLTNGAVSLPVAVSAYIGADMGFKKIFISKKQQKHQKEKESNIKRRKKLQKKGKDIGKDKGLITTSLQKETDLMEKVIIPLKDKYASETEYINLLKNSSLDMVKDLLDKGENHFYDEYKMLTDDFTPLSWKDKESLVSLVKELEEKKKGIEKRYPKLESMLEQLENQSKKRETIHVSKTKQEKTQVQEEVEEFEEKQRPIKNNNEHENKKTVSR